MLSNVVLMKCRVRLCAQPFSDAKGGREAGRQGGKKAGEQGGRGGKVLVKSCNKRESREH